MKTLKVKLTFTENVLGTLPGDKEVYETYIASKAPDAATISDEIAAVGVDEVLDKGTTVFPRTVDGEPAFYDYHIKGFFKDAEYLGKVFRFAGQIAPIVAGPTFSIRVPASRVFALEEYVGSGIMSVRQKQIITDLIRKHRNVLVMGGTGSCVIATSPNAEIAKQWLAFAKLSFAGNIQSWRILGNDPILRDVYGTAELVEPNQFFDYFGDDMFAVVESMLDDIPDTAITDKYPIAADIVKNQMAYELVVAGTDPAEVAKNCADELRNMIQ